MAAAPRSWTWTWACACCGGRKGGAGPGETGGAGAGASGRAEEGDEWSLFIDMPVLEAATDGFSDCNLLGPVYKAILAFLSTHVLQYSVQLQDLVASIE